MAESGIKRNIPISLGNFSVIDTEFSNIRERFDAEMRKMEDEMTRFRSELMNRESNFFTKSTTRRGTSTPPPTTHVATLPPLPSLQVRPTGGVVVVPKIPPSSYHPSRTDHVTQSSVARVHSPSEEPEAPLLILRNVTPQCSGGA
uniref:Uncharacterized protein n=1 Tax=Timema tahoe TaxID=61484 RepID=A0A7R9IEM2_9NEOP|nr:unnamed protein product [Timema tahoe]